MTDITSKGQLRYHIDERSNYGSVSIRRIASFHNRKDADTFFNANVSGVGPDYDYRLVCDIANGKSIPWTART